MNANNATARNTKTARYFKNLSAVALIVGLAAVAILTAAPTDVYAAEKPKGVTMNVTGVEHAIHNQIDNQYETHADLSKMTDSDGDSSGYTRVEGDCPWVYSSDLYMTVSVQFGISIPGEYWTGEGDLRITCRDHFADHGEKRIQNNYIRTYASGDLLTEFQKTGQRWNQYFSQYLSEGNNDKTSISISDGKAYVTVHDIAQYLTSNADTGRWEGTFRLKIRSSDFDLCWAGAIWQELRIYEVDLVNAAFMPVVEDAGLSVVEYGGEPVLSNIIRYPESTVIHYRILGDGFESSEYDSDAYVVASPIGTALDAHPDIQNPGIYDYTIYAADAVSGAAEGCGTASIAILNDMPVAAFSAPEEDIEYFSTGNFMRVNFTDGYCINPSFEVVHADNPDFESSDSYSGSLSQGENLISLDPVAQHKGLNYVKLVIRDGYTGTPEFNDAGITEYIFTITVSDTTSPVVRLLGGADGAVRYAPDLTFQISDYSEISYIEYRFYHETYTIYEHQTEATILDGLNVYNVSLSQLGLAQLQADWTIFDDGFHMITILAEDASENAIHYNGAGIIKDTTGPSIQAEGMWYWGLEPDGISAVSIDEQTGYPESVVLQCNASAMFTMRYDPLHETYVLDNECSDWNAFTGWWQSLSDSISDVNVNIISTDSLGNSNNASKTVIRDMDPPSIIDSVYTNASRTVPTIELEIEEEYGISLYCRIGDQGPYRFMEKCEGGDPRLSFSPDEIEWESLQDGEIAIGVIIEDMAGNEHMASFSVDKDTTAPEGTFRIGDGTCNDTIPIYIAEYDEAFTLLCRTGDQTVILTDCSGILPENFWNSVGYGCSELSILISDNLGNQRSELLEVTKTDSTPHEIELIMSEAAGAIAPSFQLTVSDMLRNSYTGFSGQLIVNGISSSFTISEGGTVISRIPDDIWNGALRREVNVTFAITDPEGFTVTEERIIERTDYFGDGNEGGIGDGASPFSPDEIIGRFSWGMGIVAVLVIGVSSVIQVVLSKRRGRDL